VAIASLPAVFAIFLYTKANSLRVAELERAVRHFFYAKHIDIDRR
jgi:hypothetical protein